MARPTLVRESAGGVAVNEAEIVSVPPPVREGARQGVSGGQFWRPPLPDPLKYLFDELKRHKSMRRYSNHK